MILRLLNLLFFLVMIFMNYLANAIPINGKTTGQLSDAYPNLFVPAGFTFSIWGIIYLLLAVFVIAQFNKANYVIIEKIGWLFIISSVLNGMWIIAWHYQKLSLSLLIMLGILATLILINLKIKELPLGLVKASFGIYLGWICVATIANVTALLVNIGWKGFGLPEEAWSVIMIIAGLSIIAVSIFKTKNPYLGLAAAWAFAGIAAKQHGMHLSIFITSIAAVVLALIAAGIFLYTWLYVLKSH